MNRKFNGSIAVSKVRRNPKGYTSKAAKQAFDDIRADKSMRVHVEIFGYMEELCSVILTEDILCEIE